MFMSRRVCGGGRGGLAGVCVMRLEVGGGEDARGRFVQNRSYKFASKQILQSISARAWGERFLALSRIFCRVGRIEEALRSRSSPISGSGILVPTAQSSTSTTVLASVKQTNSQNLWT